MSSGIDDRAVSIEDYEQAMYHSQSIYSSGKPISTINKLIPGRIYEVIDKSSTVGSIIILAGEDNTTKCHISSNYREYSERTVRIDNLSRYSFMMAPPNKVAWFNECRKLQTFISEQDFIRRRNYGDIANSPINQSISLTDSIKEYSNSVITNSIKEAKKDILYGSNGNSIVQEVFKIKSIGKHLLDNKKESFNIYNKIQTINLEEK